MPRILFLAAASLLASYSAGVAADTYTLDANHTNIIWHANHFGFSNPSGKFAKTTGSFTLDEKTPANSKVDVMIDTGSIVTGIEKFDQHLKGADFFNSEKYPSARFVSTKIDPRDATHAMVTGDLTLHGVTKPVNLDVTLNKIGEGAMSKKKTAGFSATGTLKRSEFGINYALPGVSDDVKLTIDVEGTLADTASNAIDNGKASANPKIR